MPASILVVEDSSELLQLFTTALTNAGYRVLAAENGEAALRVSFEDNSAPAILLTDILLPGINGHVLATEIVRRRPATKVGFMSGWFDPELIKVGVCSNCWCLLRKPFTLAELLRFVETVASQCPCQGLTANSGSVFTSTSPINGNNTFFHPHTLEARTSTVPVIVDASRRRSLSSR